MLLWNSRKTAYVVIVLIRPNLASLSASKRGTFSLSFPSKVPSAEMEIFVSPWIASYLPIFFIRFSVNKISRAARRNSRALNEANPLSSSRTPSCSRGFRDARIAVARRNLARAQVLSRGRSIHRFLILDYRDNRV